LALFAFFPVKGHTLSKKNKTRVLVSLITNHLVKFFYNNNNHDLE
jgi:hypothetical protein